MALFKPLGKDLIIYLCFHNKGYGKKGAFTKSAFYPHTALQYICHICSKFCILSIMDDTVCDTHLYLHCFANLSQDQTFTLMVAFTYRHRSADIPTLILEPLKKIPAELQSGCNYFTPKLLGERYLKWHKLKLWCWEFICMEGFSRTAKIVNLASLPLWQFIPKSVAFYTAFNLFQRRTSYSVDKHSRTAPYVIMASYNTPLH